MHLYVVDKIIKRNANIGKVFDSSKEAIASQACNTIKVVNENSIDVNDIIESRNEEAMIGLMQVVSKDKNNIVVDKSIKRKTNIELDLHISKGANVSQACNHINVEDEYIIDMNNITESINEEAKSSPRFCHDNTSSQIQCRNKKDVLFDHTHDEVIGFHMKEVKVLDESELLKRNEENTGATYALKNKEEIENIIEEKNRKLKKGKNSILPIPTDIAEVSHHQTKRSSSILSRTITARSSQSITQYFNKISTTRERNNVQITDGKKTKKNIAI